MYKEILKQLEKRYDISTFETKIISVLINKELTANEICATAKIPKGRIYAFLNSLFEKRLIKKIERNPAVYTAENLKERVSAFLDRRFYEKQMRETEMISLLNQASMGKIEIIDDDEKYKQHILKMLEEADTMNSIIRGGVIPFVLYPRDKKDYLKVRMDISSVRPTFTGVSDSTYYFHEKYHELSTFTKLNYITDTRSITTYIEILKKCFGNNKFKPFIKERLQYLEKYDSRIKIAQESFPYSLHVSDKKALIYLIYKKSIVGLITTSKPVVEIYQQIFNKYYLESMSIHRFLSKSYGIKNNKI